MDVGPLIVIFLRLIIPFTILRWPFWGTIASLLADAFDASLILLLGRGELVNYHRVDKLLDTYYLTFALIKSWSWQVQARTVSIALYAYRLVGVIIFEITQMRAVLLVFPNLFEFFYLFWSARNKWWPKIKLTTKTLLIILLVILVIKLFHEYSLHLVDACNKPNFNFCGLEKYPPMSWVANFMNSLH